MGTTLSTLRKYVRREVNDVAPTRKMSSDTLTHDDSTQTTYFRDESYDFDSEGIEVGDVIYNTSDGGSIAVIRQIGGSGNHYLYVDSIDGGSDNNYENGDVVYIYDKYAQGGLDTNRFTNTEITDAINQAQKLVAVKFGGIIKRNVEQDIKKMTKLDLVNVSGSFTVGETVTGGTNGHTATVEYAGSDFLIVTDIKIKVNIDNKSGTLLVGETVTGATNSYTAKVEEVGADYLMLSDPTGVFDDNEELEGSTSGATCDVDEASGYNSGKFKAAETLTGGTSGATGDLKETYSENNIQYSQALPTDLKDVIEIKYWDGSVIKNIAVRDIVEFSRLPYSTGGDPERAAVMEDRIWLWPHKSTEYNSILRSTRGLLF